jgi:hypothetical protein
MSSAKFTKRQRHRVLSRWFRADVLVLQYEVEGFVPEYTGGASVEGSVQKWWVDARPEWLLGLKEKFNGV